MGDFLSVDVDARGLLAAMDRLGHSLEARLLEVSRDTADQVAREAKSRVARRTGATAEGIIVERARVGAGYVVIAQKVEPRVIGPNLLPHHRAALQKLSPLKESRKNIPAWLEFGTNKMLRQPFLFPSVEIAREGHMRRLREAVQDGIDAVGLGD